MKRCQFCAEDIQDAAVVCRFCNRDLVAVPPLPQTISRNSPHPVGRILSSLGGLAIALFALFLSLLSGTLATVNGGYRPVVVGLISFGLLAFALSVIAHAAIARAARQRYSLIAAGMVSAVVFAVGATVGVRPDTAARFQSIQSPVATADDASVIGYASSSPARQPGLTMANYLRIREGMSYREVVAILGEPGEEVSRSDLVGITTVMYSWQRWNGANMNAMFQNNALVSKAQFGLD